MFLLGIFSVLQTILLPGYILYTVLRIKTSTSIQKFIYVFALSLFFNYTLVTLLTLLGIYKALLIYVIFFMEITILFYLLRRQNFQINLSINIRDTIDQYFLFIKSLNPSGKILLLTVSIIIIFYASLFVANLGTIFYFVDTVNNIHWNTWAIDFANNSLPELSSHFPQLIPANWSINYIMTGVTNIHFFPKSYMPLFFFSNLLMLLDLGISTRKNVYLITLIIYGLFAPVIYSLIFIADGNGDLPVSFFAFLSFYAYLKSNQEKFILKEYLLIFLFASMAAGTKLAGFYIFFFMSLLCLYQFIKNINLFSKKKIFQIFLFVVGVLIINLFWYLLKPKTMAGGLHQPEWLAAGYLNIIINALHMLYYNLGLPIVAFLIITLLFSLLVKESRVITLFFVIPPIVLWMFKYSSDFRNLSFVIPFISYSSAFGSVKIFQILKGKNIQLTLKKKSKTDNKIKKGALYAYSTLLISTFIFFLISNNTFYHYLYLLYSFINKYYFLSNRIIYFIDYTFFVHVDYYQKVYIAMLLILALISLLYISKLRIRDLLITLFIVVITLNFTALKKESIINYQQQEFDKVDAHNYYQTINTIVKSIGLSKKITTNFNPICYEKIPREISFEYSTSDNILKHISNYTYINELSSLYFLNLKYLDIQKKKYIQQEISNNRIKVIYDDGDYLFLEKHG